MRKRKILITIFACIFLIVGVSSVVLYKLGDRIFNEMIDAQIGEIEKAMASGDIDSNTPSSPNNQSASPQGAGQTDTASGNNQANPTDQPKINDSTNPQASSTPQSENKPAETLQVTKEKLENIKDSISASDKVTAATMVVSRLSQSDIKHITEMTAGGINAQEKKELLNIVYSRFTPDEINKIKEMYSKYMK